jgi:hypothetical protein
MCWLSHAWSAAEPLVDIGFNSLPVLAALLLVLGCLVGIVARSAWPRYRRGRAAARRAEALVRRVLSSQEYADLQRQGFFKIPSRLAPGRVYCVPRRGSPVAVLEPDGRLLYLCLQPTEPIPIRELVVIDKLLLEADEASYWRRANRVGRPMGRGVGRRLLG